jgi:site-specific recombinase XerD
MVGMVKFTMKNRYESVVYSNDIRKMLSSTLLTASETEQIRTLKNQLKHKSYSSVIEDFYKFHKNKYTTAYLAELFDVSIRQIQNIFKELGINRNRYEAQIVLDSQKLKQEIVDEKTSQSVEKLHFNSTYDNHDDLPERLQEFLNYLSVIRGKSHNTIDGYRIDLTLFFKFLELNKELCPKETKFSDIVINNINDDFIQNIKLPDFYAFLAYVENTRDNSSFARARKVAAVKSFFKYLHLKARILNENPAAELETPKISKRNPIYLTLDESRNLLKSIDEKYKHNKRDFCIITLFLNCGLRLSELCSIDISKIKEDTLTIVGKGNKERTVYLNNACLNAISEYMHERAGMEILPEHRDALFISERRCRLNKRTVEIIVKKYIQASGLDKSRYTAHKLRHTAATLMYKHGNVDIEAFKKFLATKVFLLLKSIHM